MSQLTKAHEEPTPVLAKRIRFILPRDHKQEPIRRAIELIHETLRRRRAQELQATPSMEVAKLLRRLEECARLYLDLAGDITRIRIEERCQQVAPHEDPMRFIVVAQWAAGLLASDFPEVVSAAGAILFSENAKMTPEELEQKWQDSVWCVQEMLQRSLPSGGLSAEQKKGVEAIAELKGEHVQVAILGYLPEEEDWKPSSAVEDIIASRDKAFCDYIEISERYEKKHQEFCDLADEISCQKQSKSLWGEFSVLEKKAASFPFWLHACLWVDIAKELGVMSRAQEGRMMAQVGAFMPGTLEFWQVMFADLLDPLTPEIRDLLRWCIEHPKKINRHRTPAALIDFRRSLRVWDWVWLNAAQADKADFIKAVTDGSDDDVRLFFSDFLARCMQRRKLSDDDLQVLVRKIGEMLGTDLLQYTQGLAESYSFEYGDRRIRSAVEIAEDRDWEALLAEESELKKQQELAAAFRTRGAVTADAAVTGPYSPLPTGRQFHFSYVENWGAKDLRTVDFSTTEDGLAERLAQILPEQGVPLTMPAASIARAILHYLCDTPAEMRAVMNKEHVGNVSWHKLRRDRIRIFIRETDGRVFFHVMLRRDWKKSDLIERRY